MYFLDRSGTPRAVTPMRHADCDWVPGPWHAREPGDLVHRAHYHQQVRAFVNAKPGRTMRRQNQWHATIGDHADSTHAIMGVWRKNWTQKELLQFVPKRILFEVTGRLLRFLEQEEISASVAKTGLIVDQKVSDGTVRCFFFGIHSEQNRLSYGLFTVFRRGSYMIASIWPKNPTAVTQSESSVVHSNTFHAEKLVAGGVYEEVPDEFDVYVGLEYAIAGDQHTLKRTNVAFGTLNLLSEYVEQPNSEDEAEDDLGPVSLYEQIFEVGLVEEGGDESDERETILLRNDPRLRRGTRGSEWDESEDEYEDDMPPAEEKIFERPMPRRPRVVNPYY